MRKKKTDENLDMEAVAVDEPNSGKPQEPDSEEAAAAAAACAEELAENIAPAEDNAAENPPPAAGDGADEVARLRDQLLRLQADFDNYRKRVLRDDAQRVRRATERLITDLLPVLDHFEMGLKAARDAGVEKGILEGLELVLVQLCEVLKKENVIPVETAGMEFDPQYHECVVHLPSAEHAENMIIAETRRGYRLGNYLLRPAQVVVSSGEPCDSNNDSKNNSGYNADDEADTARNESGATDIMA